MEQWKELQLLKNSPEINSLGVPWPELKGTGLARADLCNYLMAFGENGAVKAVDFPSITSQADCKLLASGGLTVSWQPSKVSAASAASKSSKPAEKKQPVAAKKDEDVEKKDGDEVETAAAKEAGAEEETAIAAEDKEEDDAESKKEAEAEGEEEQKDEDATTATPIAPGATGKCVANTAITGDRRTHAVAAGLRALLQMDKDSPDVTKANVIKVAPTDPKSELSPAFAPVNGIRVSGVVYKSPDHYLACQKAELFGTADEKEKILSALTAESARKLGKQVKNFDDAKWSEHRAEAVFAAVIAAVYATRRNYYTLITSGEASFTCEGRPAWAVGLVDARLFLMCRDFGAHLFNHPNIGFTVTNRITLLGGIKGHGVRIQSLCDDCLAKPRAIGSWQRLLYALRHGRNLASAVNRSGVILLISDLLYKESTDPDVARLAINVCAALAEELGFLDKEVCGFLIKYYLHQRDTWCVLGSLENLYYTDEVSKQAYSIFFGGKSSKVDKNDIYHRTHAAKALSKLLTSPKATMLAIRMSSPESVKVLIDTLAGCQYHSSLGGWNDLISDLSSSCMKCLLLIGKHLASKKEDLSFMVPKLAQFLSCGYNDDVQSHCAVLLEKTAASLNDAAIASILALVRKEFVELKLQAPERAEDLCDLLAVLAGRSTDAADLLFTLGTDNFATWAMPVLTTANTALKEKSALSKVAGFHAKVSAILKQAIDHSDESAIEDLAAFADTVSQSEAGITALQDVGFLSPLLQWVTEVDEEDQTAVQDTLGSICQRLTTNVLVAEENAHILQLMLEVLVNVHRPKAQSFILQGFLNLVAAGTTKATFETCINLQALNKAMVGKQNQVTAAKLLTNLGVKVETKEAAAAAAKDKADAKKPDAARTQGSKKGEVDTMAFQTNSDNPFQLLVATRKPKDTDADAASPSGKSSGSPAKAKAPKGFSLISAKTQKDKDKKKKSSAAGAAGAADGKGKYAQRVSVHKKPAPIVRAPPAERETKYADRGDRGDRGGDVGNRYNGNNNNTRSYDDDRDYQRRGAAPTAGGGYQESAYNNRIGDDNRYSRDSRDVRSQQPPSFPGGSATPSGPTPKYRDATKPGGGTVVNYAKDTHPRGGGAGAAEDTVAGGARVFKTQARGGKGVNLGKLGMEMSQSRNKSEEKKPTTWAGVAKFANEREAREERAEKDAEEQKRLYAEERARIDNMRKNAAPVPAVAAAPAPMAVSAPASIDSVSELFKKLLPGGAAIRSVVSTDRDMKEMEADRRRMEQRQAERDYQRRQDDERKEMDQKRQADMERQNALAERQRREQEARREQEEREQDDRRERERQEGLRKAREDAERAAAAVSGGSLSWNSPQPQQTTGMNPETANAIKSGWDVGPIASINQQQGQHQQQQQQSPWGMPTAQPAPLGNNRGGGAPGLPQGGFPGPFGPQNFFNNQQQQQGNNNTNSGNQQFRGNNNFGAGGYQQGQFTQYNNSNNNVNQGPVGGRPGQGHNNSHPWQQQQQQTQQAQQHWQGQQAQFRVQQQGGNSGGGYMGGNTGGGGSGQDQQRNFGGGASGAIPPPMHQPSQGIPQQQQQAANANYYQTSQGNNNVRLNAGAGVFDGRLQ